MPDAELEKMPDADCQLLNALTYEYIQSHTPYTLGQTQGHTAASSMVPYCSRMIRVQNCLARERGSSISPIYSGINSKRGLLQPVFTTTFTTKNELSVPGQRAACSDWLHPP